MTPSNLPLRKRARYVFTAELEQQQRPQDCLRQSSLSSALSDSSTTAGGRRGGFIPYSVAPASGLPNISPLSSTPLSPSYLEARVKQSMRTLPSLPPPPFPPTPSMASTMRLAAHPLPHTDRDGVIHRWAAAKHARETANATLKRAIENMNKARLMVAHADREYFAASEKLGGGSAILVGNLGTEENLVSLSVASSRHHLLDRADDSTESYRRLNQSRQKCINLVSKSGELTDANDCLSDGSRELNDDDVTSITDSSTKGTSSPNAENAKAHPSTSSVCSDMTSNESSGTHRHGASGRSGNNGEHDEETMTTASIEGIRSGVNSPIDSLLLLSAAASSQRTNASLPYLSSASSTASSSSGEAMSHGCSASKMRPSSLIGNSCYQENGNALSPLTSVHHDGGGRRNGILHYPNGTFYEGEISKTTGLRDGYGTVFSPSKSSSPTAEPITTYRGQWKDDLRHGSGKQWYLGGDVFDGEWARDKRNGRGTYYWKNGRADICQYANHAIIGKGAQWSPCRRRAYLLLDGIERGKISTREAARFADDIGLDVPIKPRKMK